MVPNLIDWFPNTNNSVPKKFEKKWLRSAYPNLNDSIPKSYEKNENLNDLVPKKCWKKYKRSCKKNNQI